MSDRLFTADVCRELGLTESDWRARKTRKQVPEPDGYDRPNHPNAKPGPFWLRATIDAYRNRNQEEVTQ